MPGAAGCGRAPCAARCPSWVSAPRCPTIRLEIALIASRRNHGVRLDQRPIGQAHRQALKALNSGHDLHEPFLDRVGARAIDGGNHPDVSDTGVDPVRGWPQPIAGQVADRCASHALADPVHESDRQPPSEHGEQIARQRADIAVDDVRRCADRKPNLRSGHGGDLGCDLKAGCAGWSSPGKSTVRSAAPLGRRHKPCATSAFGIVAPASPSVQERRRSAECSAPESCAIAHRRPAPRRRLGSSPTGFE
jgi:hypothetical protein